MKARIADFFSYVGHWSQLHILAAALIGTGVFMAFTSSELGPMQPLVIAFALYACFFGLLLEVLVLVRVGVRAVARRHRA